jgi:hypothetical protein
VRRIDELFEIERTINGLTPPQRVAVRQAKSKPLVADLEVWLRQKLALLSSKSDTAKAINYSLTVGTRLPASLMTVASASQTTQQSFRSAVWPSEEKIGPSRVPMPGATEQPRSIPSSRHASSTTSIHKLGPPTCWHACPITQQIRSRIFCRGIGKPRGSPSPPDRPHCRAGPPGVLARWIPSSRVAPRTISSMSCWHGTGRRPVK